MAISEVCQFEVVEEVDKAVNQNRVTKKKAMEDLQRFYKSIGIDVKYATIERKYHRAKKEKLTNVSPKSNTEIKTGVYYDPNKDSATHPKTKRGGKRKGAGRPSKPVFNAVNENIDWAKWSWNPVTGCKHNCSYCYARDIANRFLDQFPKGFEPQFRPERLEALYSTIIPERRKNEKGIDNVFVCSMADLFGDWVSEKWINQILEVCGKSRRWNYIFLTKNPKRYLEFEFPPNAWLGATGDVNKRAAEAQDILSQITSHVTFLSCEPLLEKVELKKGAVDWVII